jgi:hypothetical protein
MTQTLDRTDVEEDLSISNCRLAHCYRTEDADRLLAGVVKSMIALCGHRTDVVRPVVSNSIPLCSRCVNLYKKESAV